MTTPEERIAELLRALPAPPTGWAEAAKELALEPGSLAVASVKATVVTLEKPRE